MGAVFQMGGKAPRVKGMELRSVRKLKRMGCKE